MGKTVPGKDATVFIGFRAEGTELVRFSQLVSPAEGLDVTLLSLDE